jgi:hypothetical protein
MAAAAVQMVNNHLGDVKAILSPNPRSLCLIWEEWTSSGLMATSRLVSLQEKKGGKTSASSAVERFSGCNW